MNILTDEEINDIFRGSWNCEEDNLTRGRDIESAVVEKLKDDGWAQLKPGQVVAHYHCPDCERDLTPEEANHKDHIFHDVCLIEVKP